MPGDRATQRRYRRTALGRAVRMLTRLRHRAGARRVTITAAWIAEQLPHGCAKCRCRFRASGRGTGPNTPTVDQIAPRRGYTPDNAVLLCKRCNEKKGSLTAAEKREWASWEDDLLFMLYQPKRGKTQRKHE